MREVERFRVPTSAGVPRRVQRTVARIRSRTNPVVTDVDRADARPEPIIPGHISFMADGSIDEAMTYSRLLD